ncbi:NADH:flavin oxidoreductase/NADH oxidase [Macrolepiota fuliginosa MF-IS2]|uniref:NADH:flavin oxidoreductase/NADH oxidase n=1 Tax=Macrolepiota fuliginosa MF-IS2 TaxID=1400762 RepID=A0A9P5XA61_9AGAR|nr:NADH:flavin oxidoreductase/NADH oxidase [Macrolepiota fuliginosa MF-IS2]
MTISAPKLFQPFSLGKLALKHRIVMSPLTRYRATRLTHVPINPMVKTYYAQRSNTPGTLIVTEATLIAAKAGGFVNVPGIWSQEQIQAWKEITDAVHANGSHIFVQLWALGRTAHSEELHEEDPSLEYIAPSPIPLSNRTEVPRKLTVPEIKEFVELFAQAARNAIAAGFDGVEIHNANGYLPDQFLKEISNQRTDEYGGSIENRSRFTLEVSEAVVNAIGEEKTGIRLSPWGVFQDMKIEDPIPQFSYLVQKLKERFPNFAYLHVIEPVASGPEYADKSNDFLRKIWHPKPFISASNHTRESAVKAAREKDDLVAFGRLFIANPDLPTRLRHDLSLNEPDHKTFYTHGDAPVGYTDYPFAGGEQGKGHLDSTQN